MDYNYFTAEEARQRVEELIQTKLEEDIDFVYARIEEDIKLRRRVANIEFGNEEITKELMDFLTNKGFSVSKFHGDQRDPCNQLVVKW